MRSMALPARLDLISRSNQGASEGGCMEGGPAHAYEAPKQVAGAMASTIHGLGLGGCSLVGWPSPRGSLRRPPSLGDEPTVLIWKEPRRWSGSTPRSSIHVEGRQGCRSTAEGPVSELSVGCPHLRRRKRSLRSFVVCSGFPNRRQAGGGL